MGRKLTDLTGQKFGRLTVVSFSHVSKHNIYWNVMCTCGTKKSVQSAAIKSGATVSCGCYSSEKTREREWMHGLTKTPIMDTWNNMIQRCKNPNHPLFKNYGGRGISVCDRWLKFENFFDDMGHPPPRLSIDRIDNEKGYCKDNCRWATSTEQNRNRRGLVLVEYQGRLMTIAESAEISGIPYAVIRSRLKAKTDLFRQKSKGYSNVFSQRRQSA